MCLVRTSQAGANATNILSLSGGAVGRTLTVQSYDTTLGGAGFDINATASAGEITLQTNTKDRLRIGSNGDVSLFEDTGTTAKLTWDASAESLNFADNGKAVFGAGNDLQIYHDGSNSYVTDQGTGNLVLRGGNFVVDAQTSGNARLITANATSKEVKLYNDDNQKLATTSTGIDVTGTVTAADLTLSDSVPQISLTDSDGTDQISKIFRSGANLIIRSRNNTCLLYTSPSPRDGLLSRMPSSA